MSEVLSPTIVEAVAEIDYRHRKYELAKKIADSNWSLPTSDVKIKASLTIHQTRILGELELACLGYVDAVIREG